MVTKGQDPKHRPHSLEEAAPCSQGPRGLSILSTRKRHPRPSCPGLVPEPLMPVTPDAPRPCQIHLALKAPGTLEVPSS